MKHHVDSPEITYTFSSILYRGKSKSSPEARELSFISRDSKFSLSLSLTLKLEI